MSVSVFPVGCPFILIVFCLSVVLSCIGFFLSLAQPPYALCLVPSCCASYHILSLLTVKTSMMETSGQESFPVSIAMDNKRGRPIKNESDMFCISLQGSVPSDM